jgi:hypothetical protein
VTVSRSIGQPPPVGEAHATPAVEEPTMRGFERLVALVALIAAIALNTARPA